MSKNVPSNHEPPISPADWEAIVAAAFSPDAEPHVFSDRYQKQKQKQEELLMNNFMNKLYVKALVTANMAKNELQKMREEDEGLDIIITIILVAVGLVLVGILVNYAKKIVSTADSQVNQIGNTVGGLNSTVK